MRRVSLTSYVVAVIISIAPCVERNVGSLFVESAETRGNVRSLSSLTTTRKFGIATIIDSTDVATSSASASAICAIGDSSICTSTSIWQQVLSVPKGGDSSVVQENVIDWTAMYKYTFGVTVQISLLYGLLTIIDFWVKKTNMNIPFAMNFFFLYMFNLKTSIFSILPQTKNSESRKLTKDYRQQQERKMVVLKKEKTMTMKKKIPSWTPPPIAFVIGWPLLTFGLRAYTGAIIVDKFDGKYATYPIMTLMLHFCIGTLWNTVNTVENRLGVSVVLLWSLWVTKAYAAYQFYQIDPNAGKLLSLSLLWITAAVALQTRTWQINPRRTNNHTNNGNGNNLLLLLQQKFHAMNSQQQKSKLDPLLPMKRYDGSPSITKFKWE